MPADAAGRMYGDALFEAAEAAGEIDAVQRDLQAMGNALAKTPELARVLFNPAFPEAGKKQVLARMTASGSPLVQNTIQVLVDHGRLTAPPDVISAYDERYGRLQTQLEVELTTAVPIDDAQAEALRARLSAQTGRRVELVRTVDPYIVGGLVLRVRDLLIDASVRGKLEALRLNFRRARLAAGPGTPGGPT